MSLRANRAALGYEQISSLDTAKGLTPPAGATFAVIQPQTQAVRWRDDGTDPSGSVGMPLAVGADLEYGGPLDRIRFIEQTASAVLNVSYYS